MGWMAMEDAPRRPWSVHALRVLLGSRALASALLGAVSAHLMSVWLLGYPLAACSLYSLTGRPCPGCGLSRAALLLLRGDLAGMWQVHPFTPYFAWWAVMLAGAVFLPARGRTRWATAWTALEARTRLHAAGLILFLVFGTVRLLSGRAPSL